MVHKVKCVLNKIMTVLFIFSILIETLSYIWAGLLSTFILLNIIYKTINITTLY